MSLFALKYRENEDNNRKIMRRVRDNWIKNMQSLWMRSPEMNFMKASSRMVFSPKSYRLFLLLFRFSIIAEVSLGHFNQAGMILLLFE